jgi:TRAP-type C4-dicarboxylate transport system permease small subunit
MVRDVIVAILIAVGVSIVFISHANLNSFQKVFGISSELPHWAFVYVISPSILFTAYFIKHQSAGFIDFLISRLREFNENTNKE